MKNQQRSVYIFFSVKAQIMKGSPTGCCFKCSVLFFFYKYININNSMKSKEKTKIPQQNQLNADKIFSINQQYTLKKIQTVQIKAGIGAGLKLLSKMPASHTKILGFKSQLHSPAPCYCPPGEAECHGSCNPRAKPRLCSCLLAYYLALLQTLED